MHLVQILLPLFDNAGQPFLPEAYRGVSEELTRRFGGLTAFTRAPAEGTWKPEGGTDASHDEIVVFEVMAESLDRGWWRDYRAGLEQRFRQDAIVIRAQPIELL
jgi:hypothetical protein